MQKRKSFLPTFLIFFIISILLFVLSRAGFLNGLTGFLETGTVPIQRAVFGLIHSGASTDSELRAENMKLAAELAKQNKEEHEMQALRDQFQTANPASRNLLPAVVIGSGKDSLVIDRGSLDKVKKGDVVIIKDNLIGRIDKSSEHISSVNLITSGNMSFTAKTLKTESLGILTGQGGALLLNNVVLADHLEKDDLVVTKGDIDSEGNGFPPGLVVGKIVSIDKKASNLFQNAEVRSLVDFGKLETVFVLISN